jgi:hypothetical protein
MAKNYWFTYQHYKYIEYIFSLSKYYQIFVIKMTMQLV